MTKKIVRPAIRYCECGCGAELGANVNQRFTVICREIRKQVAATAKARLAREAIALSSPVRMCACGAVNDRPLSDTCESCRMIAKAKYKREHKKGRPCKCGAIITRRGGHDCDACQLARVMKNLTRSHSSAIETDPAIYPQIEPIFKPWVRKETPMATPDDTDYGRAIQGRYLTANGLKIQPGGKYAADAVTLSADRVRELERLYAPPAARVPWGNIRPYSTRMQEGR